MENCYDNGSSKIVKTPRDKNYIVSKLQRKRKVLRLFLKIGEDRKDFMFSGNLFHTSGAA